jgi:hypothetical protein
MITRIRILIVALLVVLTGIGIGPSLAGVTPGPSAAAARSTCGKFSGTVVLTYHNPDTIVLHIIKGKVNAATPFTMTPQTTYQRNGQPATFDDVKIGDVGTITATEQLPSGVLLACTVSVSGP